MKSKFVLMMMVICLSNASMAQEQGSLFQVPADTGDNTYAWIEVHFGRSTFPEAGAPDYPDGTAKLKNPWNIPGGTWAGGVEPFRPMISINDTGAMKVFKSIGFFGDGGMFSTPGGAIGRYERPLPNETYVRHYCHSEQMVNPDCRPCGSPSGMCIEEDLKIDDVHYRFVQGSVALGMYLPVSVAKHFQVSGGTSMRFSHFTDRDPFGKESEFKRSVNALVKIQYLRGDNRSRWGVGGAYERSISGFKNRRVSFHGVFRFGEDSE